MTDEERIEATARTFFTDAFIAMRNRGLNMVPWDHLSSDREMWRDIARTHHRKVKSLIDEQLREAAPTELELTVRERRRWEETAADYARQLFGLKDAIEQFNKIVEEKLNA